LVEGSISASITRVTSLLEGLSSAASRATIRSLTGRPIVVEREQQHLVLGVEVVLHHAHRDPGLGGHVAQAHSFAAGRLADEIQEVAKR
jgi:hypothetical protein